MTPTADRDIDRLLERLLTEMRAILGGKLLGLYLYGSLVMGDFDANISDIDLLAALTADLDPAEFQRLDQMHTRLVTDHPGWNDRIEIAYLSLHGLRSFRTESSPIGIISPGEPFHIIEAGRDWLVNWYMVQEIGVALFGPPPQSVIAPIAKEEFIRIVKEHAQHWRARIGETYRRPAQAYAILTLCRALYTTAHGEQVSKVQAAAWAQQTLPQWAGLIRDALLWRQAARSENVVDHSVTLDATRRFVQFAVDRILADE